MNSKEIKSGLKTSILMNNKTMNSKEIKSCLTGSNLMNNKIMDNHTRTCILDEPVPHIGIETLRPTPFRRRIQSLKDTARKVVDKVKKKWNDFNDWIIDYVPPAIRVNPSSVIEKLKNYIKKLYQRSPDFTPIEKKAAKGYFKTFTIPGNEYKDPEVYLTDVTHTTTRLIESNLNKGTKVKVALHCEMVRVDPDTKEDVYTTCYFNSNLKTIIQKDTVTGEYRVMNNKILENVTNFQSRGSGWIFRKVLSMYIHLNKYEPLSGSSYIPLPKTLQKKKAVINVQNKQDNECFKWAMTSAIYPVEKNSTRVNKYVDNYKKFNWDGIEFPASLRDIEHFEKLNPPVSVNVFSYEQEVFPLRISKRANDKTVNLLLISERENQTLLLDQNMSKLLTTKVSKRRTRRFYCLRCLNSFYTAESLQRARDVLF